MSNEHQTIDLSPKELDLITAALETQRKILQVQASAGESAVLSRLNDVKRTLALFAAKSSESDKIRRPLGLWQRLMAPACDRTGCARRARQG
ncbi:MAG: hypothetical protein ACSHWZ_04815 [Sulfitobacter sp.]